MNRRQALQAFGLAGAGAALSSCAPLAALTGAGLADPAVFNFALNLEYLEAEYYLRATTGSGLSAADAGAEAGAVQNVPRGPVRFTSDARREFAEELAANELGHVRFIRSTLGDAAIDRPALDMGAFAAAAAAAGLGAGFDPFASEMNFLLGGMMLEDVGITAYVGAAPLIASRELLLKAAGILAVEGYHMGMARSHLYEMGPEARAAANAISDTRDTLDGPMDLDQGIELGGRANFVPSDPNGVAFSRTPPQVLRIVYQTSQEGVSRGGFYPEGVNGAIRST